MKGKTGMSLHIGVDHFDPNHYGDDGKLYGCELDAKKMAQIAKNQGFSTMSLLSEQATRKNVKEAIVSASKELKKGDLFFISYSGHGGQLPDRNSDEVDAEDETWCLYDGQFVDDELYIHWGDFAEGVRIFVISDSCHSGTIVKNLQNEGVSVDADRGLVKRLDGGIIQKAYLDNMSFYDDLLDQLSIKSETKVKASVQLISGCQDNQLSYDTHFGGRFSLALIKVWNGGRFRGDYHAFHKRILNHLPDYQSPNYLMVGKHDPDFAKSRPFEI